MPAKVLSSESPPDAIMCPDKLHMCPNYYSCCRMGGGWGCCPYTKVCGQTYKGRRTLYFINFIPDIRTHKKYTISNETNRLKNKRIKWEHHNSSHWILFFFFFVMVASFYHFKFLIWGKNCNGHFWWAFYYIHYSQNLISNHILKQQFLQHFTI